MVLVRRVNTGAGGGRRQREAGAELQNRLPRYLLTVSRDLAVNGINWINAELPLRSHKSLNNQARSPFLTPSKWKPPRLLPKVPNARGQGDPVQVHPSPSSAAATHGAENMKAKEETAFCLHFPGCPRGCAHFALSSARRAAQLHSNQFWEH